MWLNQDMPTECTSEGDRVKKINVCSSPLAHDWNQTWCSPGNSIFDSFRKAQFDIYLYSVVPIFQIAFYKIMGNSTRTKLLQGDYQLSVKNGVKSFGQVHKNAQRKAYIGSDCHRLFDIAFPPTWPA